jgi:hypothetical protein
MSDLSFQRCGHCGLRWTGRSFDECPSDSCGAAVDAVRLERDGEVLAEHLQHLLDLVDPHQFLKPAQQTRLMAARFALDAYRRSR